MARELMRGPYLHTPDEKDTCNISFTIKINEKSIDLTESEALIVYKKLEKLLKSYFRES